MDFPPSAVVALEVLDPEMLAEAIRDADLKPCQLSDRPAPSMVARVQCPRICLDLVAVGPAMLYEGAMPPDCYTLSFVLACPGTGRSFNFSTEFSDGYMGFFPPGAPLDASNPAGCVNAILTVPVAEFHAALTTYFPDIPDWVLARGAGMRVGAAEQASLSSLLSGIGGRIWKRTAGEVQDLACRAIERTMLPAFLAALRSGCEAIVPPPAPRIAGRYRRLRQARDFIAGHLHEPIHVGDICSELGLSERGVENLFRDLIGLNPSAFLRRQRHHSVHRSLLSSESVPGAVKKVALEFGFRHLGRFSHDYRQLFGEKPSDTLTRRELRRRVAWRPRREAVVAG